MNSEHKNWRLRVFQTAIAGGALFVVLTALAMLIYPGGTLHRPTAEHYSFGQNFFSDLGRTEDFEGNPKLLSMVLFGTALTTMGCTTTSMFFALPGLFGQDRTSKVVSFVMVAFGLVSGLGFVGIAFTPWDLYFPQHDFCVNLGFRSLLLACVGAMINVYRTRAFPNGFGHVLVAVCLILLGYILLLAFGPGMDTPAGLMIQVGGQKVVAYVLITGVSILAFGAIGVEGRNRDQVATISEPTTESQA